MVGLGRKFGFTLAAFLAPLGASAHAAVSGPAGPGLFPAYRTQLIGWNTLSGFDLATRKPGFRSHIARQKKPNGMSRAEAAQAEFQQQGTSLSGPSWSYQPGAGGPVVELAALGAGKKGRPKLVHVAIDWNF